MHTEEFAILQSISQLRSEIMIYAFQLFMSNKFVRDSSPSKNKKLA